MGAPNSRHSDEKEAIMETIDNSPANQPQISASSLESLKRAVSGQSLTNFPAIFAGFAAMGIPEFEIKPRGFAKASL